MLYLYIYLVLNPRRGEQTQTHTYTHTHILSRGSRSPSLSENSVTDLLGGVRWSFNSTNPHRITAGWWLAHPSEKYQLG